MIATAKLGSMTKHGVGHKFKNYMYIYAIQFRKAAHLLCAAVAR